MNRPDQPTSAAIENPAASRARIWAIVASLSLAGLALALRLRMMMVGRSLWLDEAALALNICGRNFAELLQPLDHDQASPIGFLWIERVSVLMFGPNEFALRLFPFLASILSLFLIYHLCARNISERTAQAALALAGLLPALYYYAGELKQYSSDVASALLILVLASTALREGLTMARAVGLGLAGMVLVWISHPAVFILAGAGTTLILNEAAKKRYGWSMVGVTVSAFWLGSFAVEYFEFLKDLQTNANLAEYWDAAFLNFPPRSSRDLRLYPTIAFGIFEALFHNAQVDVDLSLRMGVLMAALWMVGVISLYRDGQRRILMLLVMPLVFALVASMLHKYPLKSRLSLFTAAMTLPVIAAGIAAHWKSREASVRAIGCVLLACALLLPTMQGIQFLVERPRLHDARSVLTHLAGAWAPGDFVVVDRYSDLPFLYYQKYGRIDRLERVSITSTRQSLCEPEGLATEIRRWKGYPRVWFLLDTSLPDPINLSRASLKVILDQSGEPLDSISCRRYSAHLYDFQTNSVASRNESHESSSSPTSPIASVPSEPR